MTRGRKVNGERGSGAEFRLDGDESTVVLDD